MRKLKNKQVLFMATPEDHEFVKRLAEQKDISMGDVLRKLIAEYRNQHPEMENSGGVHTDNRQVALF